MAFCIFMAQIMKTKDFIDRIDRIFLRMGEGISLLNVVLVVLIVLDVIARYFLSVSEAWTMELEWHIFSLIFLFGVIYTFQYDDHVRVDVWYNERPEKIKLWVNIAGTVLFLIPWCLIVIYTSFHYALHSFHMGERSADPGGLPYRYLIKFGIVVSFSLLLFYAVLYLMKCIWKLRSGEGKIYFEKEGN